MALETSEDGDARTTHSAPAASGVVSRVLAPLALVIALIAAAGAGWALFGPARDTADTQATGSPTAAAPAGDPKANACDAFKVVSAAVSLQTHGDAGNDPAGIQAVAANARLAMEAVPTTCAPAPAPARRKTWPRPSTASPTACRPSR